MEVKVLKNYKKELFICIDREMSVAEVCSEHRIKQTDIPYDQFKNKYSVGDVLIVNSHTEKTAYVVLPGDTLDTIAQKLGCSRKTLIDMNRLKAPVVFIGQRLLYKV